MVEDLEIAARKFALQNALEYEGKASVKAVMSRVMGAAPEYRRRTGEVAEVVKNVVNDVNALSTEAQRSELAELAPELLEKNVTEKKQELTPLKNAEGGVMMRLAPNPSGPLHIGHTRMAILNDEYGRRYGGRLIVRREDTNPPTGLPEAYDMIIEDLNWLGVECHEVVNQSSRFDMYYEHARKLLELGKAYMCGCESEIWRKMKDSSRPCPHRSTGPGVNLDLWERMLAGDFQPGEMSLIVKTDLEHPNPAVRDFVALRLVDEPHPLTGDDYGVYPLYNFSVAIDDHLMGMPHVLRGKDHLNNTLRQKYVYGHLGWKEPEFIHYGWVSIEDTILSTRQIKAAIQQGEYTGWGDPRLGTVAALARRGIRPEAIRKYWLDVGAKDVDMKFSWQNLYAHNKEIVDPMAKRYFFVWEPREIMLTGVDALTSNAPLHPGHPEKGTRQVELSGDITIKVAREDLEGLETGIILRLKDLCNVEVVSEREMRFIGNDLSIIKGGAAIIHWVGPDAVEARVQMPDGSVREGLAESAALESVGEIVQFERFGFDRLEKKEILEGYFAHR